MYQSIPIVIPDQQGIFGFGGNPQTSSPDLRRHYDHMVLNMFNIDPLSANMALKLLGSEQVNMFGVIVGLGAVGQSSSSGTSG